MEPSPVQRLKDLIADVPDFPQPGIVFKDITPLLADPAGLALAVELMANPFRDADIDYVVGAESRGFIFGIAIAQSLSAGFIPIRKPGKLPRRTVSAEYTLEYGVDKVEMHADAIRPGQRILIVDDLVATGGTLGACRKLVADLGGDVRGVSVLIELTALNARAALHPDDYLHAVVQY